MYQMLCFLTWNDQSYPHSVTHRAVSSLVGALCKMILGAPVLNQNDIFKPFDDEMDHSRLSKLKLKTTTKKKLSWP